MKLLLTAMCIYSLTTVHALGLPLVQAQAVPSNSISDDEVGRFALVALVINQVERDVTMNTEQKQDAIKQAMQRNGITADRFGQIVNFSRNNVSLQRRIRAAADAQIEAVRAHQRGGQ
jgi:hypothetical protein